MLPTSHTRLLGTVSEEIPHTRGVTPTRFQTCTGTVSARKRGRPAYPQFFEHSTLNFLRQMGIGYLLSDSVGLPTASAVRIRSADGGTSATLLEGSCRMNPMIPQKEIQESWGESAVTMLSGIIGHCLTRLLGTDRKLAQVEILTHTREPRLYPRFE